MTTFNPFNTPTFLSHSHACLIFEVLAYYRDLASRFILDGLAGNEKCVMAVDTYTPQMVREDLAAVGVDFESAVEQGRLTLMEVRSAYADQGGFEPNATIDIWKEETEKAISQGYTALRVVGEATFSLGGDDKADKLIYYENIINHVLFNAYPFKSLCVYERRLYSSKVIKAAICAHPVFFYNDRFFKENIHYIPPEIHFNNETERDEIDIMIRNIDRHNVNLNALKESEAEFRMMFEKAPLSYQSMDKEGRLMEVNESWLNTLGYSRQEVIGRKFSAFLHPERQGYFDAHYPSLKSVGELLGMEFEMVKKDGTPVLISFHGKVRKHPDGTIARTHCIFQDITEKKSAEEKALRQQQAITLNNKIANVFLTATSSGIFHGTLEVILETLESPFGYFGSINEKGDLCCSYIRQGGLEALSAVLEDYLIFPRRDWIGTWGDAMEKGQTVVMNHPLTLPRGEFHLSCAMAAPIVHHGEIIGQFLVADKPGGYGSHEQYLLESAVFQTAPILSNLLEKEAREKQHKALQSRVEQAQKMEAIGSLAGGIAHDFNNILFPIIGMSEMLLEDLPEHGAEWESVLEIHKAGKRAGDLVRQILAFSRQTEHEIMPVRFQKVLKEVLKLCRSTIPANIELVNEVQQDCGFIRANATQLHQIAMNLITNAFHAVEDKNGRISVCLKEIEMAPEDLDDFSLMPGRHLRFSVADNGAGIPPDMIQKIFEPYFTTKKPGKGTGLGLAVVYGIVKAHKGDIKVYSEPGKGSAFNIYMPVMEKEGDEGKIEAAQEMQTGTEHVFLVDDEPAIANLCARILDRLGYKVTLWTSSVAALEAFRADPFGFDLVISDMSMPRMTGDLLAAEMKQIRPDIPIVICTGFSERINQENAQAVGVEGFLMKPITKSDLAGMVRKVLDARTSSLSGR